MSVVKVTGWAQHSAKSVDLNMLILNLQQTCFAHSGCSSDSTLVTMFCNQNTTRDQDAGAGMTSAADGSLSASNCK